MGLGLRRQIMTRGPWLLYTVRTDTSFMSIWYAMIQRLMIMQQIVHLLIGPWRCSFNNELMIFKIASRIGMCSSFSEIVLNRVPQDTTDYKPTSAKVMPYCCVSTIMHTSQICCALLISGTSISYPCSTRLVSMCWSNDWCKRNKDNLITYILKQVVIGT